MTDKEENIIIKNILEGDVDQFEVFVLAYEKKIYNLCLRMTGSKEDACDLTQDAFVKAYNKLDSFKGDSSFYVWLYRIASNTCLDFLRREKRSRSDSLTYENESGQIVETELPDVKYSPEILLDKKEIRENIKSGIIKLNINHRNVLLMREIEGLSYSEISKALGITEGTVKSRISRARRLLSMYLAREGNISEKKPSNKIGKRGEDHDGMQ